MGGAGAAVVGRHVEGLVAQVAHHGHHVRGHGPEAEVLTGRGGFSVAAQVRDDHAVVPREGRTQAVPHGVGLREAVQQQERLAPPGGPHVDGGPGDRDAVGLEVLEHGPLCAPRGPPGASGPWEAPQAPAPATRKLAPCADR